MLSAIEIAGHNGHKVKLAVASLALIALALVLMGSADLGSTSPAMRGSWSVLVDAAPNACGGSGRRRFSVTVESEGIVVTKVGALDGEGLRAVAHGSDLRFDVTHVNAAGVETVESIDLTLQDGVMTGTSSYTELGENGACSATAPVVGTR